MLKLPQVTLIALTGIDYRTESHLDAINKSSEGIEWGARKLVQQSDIVDIDSWNKAVIYDLWKYVDTDFAMFIHDDGYVINPQVWRDEWLKYDYIGAPWPLPTDDYSYLDEKGELQRVGNSVSLRSKKLMKLIAQRPWRSYYGNTNEDGFICCHNRKWLESKGCKFAPFKEALHFSEEHHLSENAGLLTFAYHQI